MKCEKWLDDNPEATPLVSYANNLDFESSVRKLKEDLETAQLMVADEQKLNQELNRLNSAKDEVIKSLLQEIDSARGEKAKTEAELKQELSKTMVQAEKQKNLEVSQSHVKIAGLKHEIGRLRNSMSVEIEDLKSWKLTTEDRVNTLNKFEMPYHISND